MSELDAGRIRHRVRIEAPLRTPDGGGGATETWVTVAEAWAEISPAGGTERLEADRVAGRVTHVIHMRAGVNLAPEMRVVNGTRIFEIRAAIDLNERGRWLRVLAEERDR